LLQLSNLEFRLAMEFDRQLPLPLLQLFATVFEEFQ
jgi:hypothetical protein